MTDHDWSWGKGVLNRGEARPAENSSKFIAGGLVVVTGVVLIVLVADNLTGIGVGDDALISVVGCAFLIYLEILFS